MATRDSWICPRCDYPLSGLSGDSCPECGRVTSEAEQAALAARREMPRPLMRIAQAGFVFSLFTAGWSFVGLLKWMTGSGDAPVRAWLYMPALVVSLGWVVVSVLIQRRLRALHARHEVLSWIVAHAAWAGPLAAVVLLRDS